MYVSANVPYLLHHQLPPQLAVSKASRSRTLWFKEQCLTLPGRQTSQLGGYQYYNPSLDTVELGFLDDGSTLRDLARFDIRSIGIPFYALGADAWWNAEADIRLLHNVYEIVIILGRARAECVTELVYVDENSPEVIKRYPHDLDGNPEVGEYTKELGANLASQHKKWRTYQRKREKKGKLCPNWILPQVRVAVVKSLCSSVSPYSYIHREEGRLDPEELPWGDIQ
jgi:hypothetical protein